MQTLSRGILITIEGLDGCGKSTLMRNLEPLLGHLPVVFTKEPGGTPLGQHLRTIVQQQKEPLAPQAEFLIFAADRAQHVHEVVKPALEQKKLVISDRMADSSVVYQGYARGLDLDIINRINTWVMQGIIPDLTFFIAIDPTVAYQRTRQRKAALSAFEKEQVSFMQKVLQGYEQLFKQRTNVVTLDGAQEPKILAKQAAEFINQWLINLSKK